MKKIAVTTRVVQNHTYKERRDAFDQRWSELLLSCELFPVFLPNNPAYLEQFLALESIDGILLTGGNDLCAYGGDASERDEVEHQLLSYAIKHETPVLGICRGFHIILDYFGEKLQRVENHVAVTHQLNISNEIAKDFAFLQSLNEVTAYHTLGNFEVTSNELQTIAKSEDGVVMSAFHQTHPIYGVMWHPEREEKNVSLQQQLMKTVFRS